MARKATSIGPHLLALIEDARVDLLCRVLTTKEDQSEPTFNLPATVPDQADEETIHAFRQTLIKIFAEFAPDELQPVEVRARRIRALAKDKGVTSLTTIVEQQLDDDKAHEFNQQPDELCRSAWTYLNVIETFNDAESFHFTRQFRDHGKLYEALEVELENDLVLNAVAIDEKALAARMKKLLELKPDISCTVKAIDLPSTEAHPASIMLIVRHGGPLSSVYDHRKDGRRAPIYYRPPNEATLIYTPSLRQIEVCADSPVVRQKVSNTFAEFALGHDISKKPLTWKRYNLSRFRTSLRLHPPEIEGYTFDLVRVIEVEIRLGNWGRKLQLKVTIDDVIEEIADLYLGDQNIFRRAEAFSRITIAVVYNRIGDEKQKTLNITISGTRSCNLQSKMDPEERNLGFALLKEWGIMTAFRQIEPNDLRQIFPQLLQIHDRIENTVSGAYLFELGLDPVRLIQSGFLERCGRQDVVLLGEDGVEGEGTVKPSATKGIVGIVGPFGEDAGKRPASEIEKYAIKVDWLRETLIALMRPLLSKRTAQILDSDLTLLGAMQVDGSEVPVYFARRLNDMKTAQRLDMTLRARNSAGVGIILAASEEMPAYLGPNVVMSLLSHLAPADDKIMFTRDSLELAYKNGMSLARSGDLPRVVRSGTQSGSLFIPREDPLHLAGNDQLTIFERLVAAYVRGVPDVHVGDLMQGFSARSPQSAFRPEVWKSILNVYIGKGAKRGYWRLIVASPPISEAAQGASEGSV